MNKVITISREYGAGGHTIGQKVAEELGIPFSDNDILRETAKASGFELELVEQEGEDVSPAVSILKGICSVSSMTYNDTQEAIREVQQAIILRFAHEGPCVILGRCADEVLRSAGVDCLNVFIHADAVHRALRVSELTGVTDPSELEKMLVKKDKSRHNYYRHYTGKHWGDSHNYHMSLDSGALSTDLCVEMIVKAAQAED